MIAHSPFEEWISTADASRSPSFASSEPDQSQVSALLAATAPPNDTKLRTVEFGKNTSSESNAGNASDANVSDANGSSDPSEAAAAEDTQYRE